ncbi:hypothetical protein CEK26_005406 [Fusarium fujikuroi]|nr:hypothetical protein CEK27_005410 [Fusarium fujikuroi]QGI78625.1 hypothetical protein CEK25_005354 [Fusarium fujikuroi]QGI92337.1 hypothetical protein CEK26_005406 [Fusarium fujikuroi]SCV59098.1 uncharacterized protein FFFS_13667 [Fusarium fujikuroi]VZH91925.1 unnamed protein product [Fusarium fujikuroi]
MLGIKSILLCCLLFGAVQAITTQQKPIDPKNHKPTNHLHLAKRSVTDHDKLTDHPHLARRTIDKPSKPTIHPKLVKRSVHERFNESLA